MASACRTIAVIFLLSLWSGEASAATTLRTMSEVGAALDACWTAPRGSPGSFVTLRFSFRRDGMLLGPPQPTAINVPGDAEGREKFVADAVSALEHCTPLHFGPPLADNIAGRVFTMQFPASPD